MGYAVKILDGKKHVVVDEEEIRRKVKMLQDPDELRDRCKQLESEVAYYKALAHHLEGELKDKPAHEQPSTSKAPQPNANPPSISVWPENNNHSNRHSFTQQQLLQQLQQAAAQKRVCFEDFKHTTILTFRPLLKMFIVVITHRIQTTLDVDTACIFIPIQQQFINKQCMAIQI